MSYAELPDDEVFDDIQSGNVPDNALIDALSWRHLCEVQARNSRDVDSDTWQEICKRRGKLRK